MILASDYTSFRSDLIHQVTIEMSSACNLRCVYCHQSIPGFKPLPAMNHVLFDDLVDFCRRHKIKRIDLTGGGEATFAPAWREKCETLLGLGIELSVTTNMARLLTRDEVTTLSRFSIVTISIDTVDRDLLREIRKSEDVRTITYNIAMLRAAALREKRRPPNLVLCMVLSAEILELADWLAAFAIAMGFDQLLVQDLVRFADIAEPGVRSLWVLRGEEAVRAVAAVKRFRETLEDSPVELCMPVQLTAELDAFALQNATIDVVKAAFLDEPDTKPISASQNERAAPATPGLPSVSQSPSLIPPAVNAVTLPSFGKTPDREMYSIQPAELETRDCFDPWSFLQVLSDGSVRPCCAASFTPGRIGKDGTLEEIMDAPQLREMRAGLLSGDLSQDCRSCSYKSKMPIKEFKRALDAFIAHEILPPLPPPRVPLTERIGKRLESSNLTAWTAPPGRWLVRKVRSLRAAIAS